MTSQPIPTVTSADVDRIVRRDFPADRVPEVLAVLEEYGHESWHRETYRVRVAVLKLAAGKFKKLRQGIENAKKDYRDVLAYAEYPGYFMHIPGPARPPADEERRVVEADWKQYQEWFSR